MRGPARRRACRGANGSGWRSACAGVVLVLSPKLGGGELTAWNFALAMLALLCITAGTLYQKRFVEPCDVRTANLLQLLAALAVTLPLARAGERQAIDLHPQLIGAMAWSVLGLTLGGSSLLYLLIQRGAATAGVQPDVPGAAVHGAAGLGAVRRAVHAADGAWPGAHRGRRRAGHRGAATRDNRTDGQLPGGPTMTTHRIAVIAGDGIGKEVMPEGLRVLEAAATRFGIALEVRPLRLLELGLLRTPRQDAARRLEGAHRRPRRDLLRRRRLASRRSPTMSRCGARCCSSGASSTSTSTCGRRG